MLKYTGCWFSGSRPRIAPVGKSIVALVDTWAFQGRTFWLPAIVSSIPLRTRAMSRMTGVS